VYALGRLVDDRVWESLNLEMRYSIRWLRQQITGIEACPLNVRRLWEIRDDVENPKKKYYAFRGSLENAAKDYVVEKLCPGCKEVHDTIGGIKELYYKRG
jgi:hypothetical protein